MAESRGDARGQLQTKLASRVRTILRLPQIG